ncbi:hypothetical protein V9L05_02040 [Bernardetia sp. Wsw4-3y2]|uniref:hypothetical protein n=1 Tax=Bernardetia sp. Wsw4-3y2 TaxID=3127471 RepID=UPI0030D57D59
MIKYIILTLLFLLKIPFLFGQNEDSLFQVDSWNSKENIEFMKNAYLKIIKEFGIEY